MDSGYKPLVSGQGSSCKPPQFMSYINIEETQENANDSHDGIYSYAHNGEMLLLAFT